MGTSSFSPQLSPSLPQAAPAVPALAQECPCKLSCTDPGPRSNFLPAPGGTERWAGCSDAPKFGNRQARCRKCALGLFQPSHLRSPCALLPAFLQRCPHASALASGPLPARLSVPSTPCRPLASARNTPGLC